MICPYCSVGVHLAPAQAYQVWEDTGFESNGAAYTLAWDHCPQCERLIVFLRSGKATYQFQGGDHELEWHSTSTDRLIYPAVAPRHVPPEVPARYSRDFEQAAAVVDLSPKASAALSRRILQDVIRERLGIQRHSLASEIDVFIADPGVPTSLANAVDAVRNVGNFAAHPQKDLHTAEVVDVEPGEAEWLLEVLDSLFDFAFVQPQRLAEKRDALNKKLAGIGKPPMKSR